MRLHNGGEGSLTEEGRYVNFWPLEVLMKYNRDYEVQDYAPEVFLLGSDGGGIAFGIRRNDGSFIKVDFIDMSNENASGVGNDFEEFIGFLANGIDIED